MKRFPTLTLLAALTTSSYLQSEPEPPIVHARAPSMAKEREPIKPVPLEQNLDARKVALGQKLFNEPKLSRDKSISCASCHDLTKGGTDRRTHSLGVNNAEGSINAPTVFNSGFNFKQFWDGRANWLENVAKCPNSSAGVPAVKAMDELFYPLVSLLPSLLRVGTPALQEPSFALFAAVFSV